MKTRSGAAGFVGCAVVLVVLRFTRWVAPFTPRCYVVLAHLISSSATSGRLISICGRYPARRISRIFVHGRFTLCFGLWVHVYTTTYPYNIIIILILMFL